MKYNAHILLTHQAHPGHPVPVADHRAPGSYSVSPCQGHPNILKTFYPEILKLPPNLRKKGLKFIEICINRLPQWGKTSGAAEDLSSPRVAIPYLKTPFKI